MKARPLHLPQLHCIRIVQKGLQQRIIALPHRLRHLGEPPKKVAAFQFYSFLLCRMDLYEVHVPCGQKVVLICKEKGEDVKIFKNGNPIYKENDTVTQSTTPNTAPPLPNKTEVVEEEESTPVEEESETIVENNMAGGKKSRRNTARKNNATRRKNQAGGKRGPNGYMKFANKIRPQILKEHPELKSDVVGVARKIGEKWRALSDSEKKKY